MRSAQHKTHQDKNTSHNNNHNNTHNIMSSNLPHLNRNPRPIRPSHPLPLPGLIMQPLHRHLPSRLVILPLHPPPSQPTLVSLMTVMKFRSLHPMVHSPLIIGNWATESSTSRIMSHSTHSSVAVVGASVECMTQRLVWMTIWVVLV